MFQKKRYMFLILLDVVKVLSNKFLSVYTSTNSVRVSTWLALSIIAVIFFLAKPHQISAPWPGIEPKPWQWKPRILTTRLPGNSLSIFLINILFFFLALSFIVEYNWLTIYISFRCTAKWFSYSIYISILLLFYLNF